MVCIFSLRIQLIGLLEGLKTPAAVAKRLEFTLIPDTDSWTLLLSSERLPRILQKSFMGLASQTTSHKNTWRGGVDSHQGHLPEMLKNMVIKVIGAGDRRIYGWNAAPPPARRLGLISLVAWAAQSQFGTCPE